MEAPGDLPQLALDTSAIPLPLPGALGPMARAARCVGLAPAPRPSAATATANSAAGSEQDDFPGFLLALPAPNGMNKRPPRDPAATTARKKGKAVPGATAAPSPALAGPAAPPEAAALTSTAPALAEEPELVSPTPAASGAQQAFDGMPASMDNGFFMNYTYGDPHDTPSQEFQQEESEGFVEPPIRKGRGTNFTKKEDQALCNAWRRIGTYPIVGNEQQSSLYWDRIHELYTLLLKGDVSRTASSLRHRFHTIKTDCFKWSCCLAQVDRNNPSGTNDVDKENFAQDLFMGKPKKKGGRSRKAFTLHHCWEILENDEKWKNRLAIEIPNKKPSSSSAGEGFVVDTEDDMSSSPTPQSSVNRGRSEGRKKAKNKRANGDDGGYKASLDNMMEVRKDIGMQRRDLKTKEMEEMRETEERKMAIEERRVAVEERRAAIEERRVAVEERKVAAEMAKIIENEQRIMFMDLNGLDEKARAYLEICRDQILASKGHFPSTGGNGGGAI